MGNILGGCPCCTIFEFYLRGDFNSALAGPDEDATIGTNSEKIDKAQRNELRRLVVKDTGDWLRVIEMFGSRWTIISFSPIRIFPQIVGTSTPVSIDFEISTAAKILATGTVEAIDYGNTTDLRGTPHCKTTLHVGATTQTFVGNIIQQRFVLNEFGIIASLVVPDAVARPAWPVDTLRPFVPNNYLWAEDPFLYTQNERFFFGPLTGAFNNSGVAENQFIASDEHSGFFLPWSTPLTEETVSLRVKPTISNLPLVVPPGTTVQRAGIAISASRSSIRRPIDKADDTPKYRRSPCTSSETSKINAPTFTTARWSIGSINTPLGLLAWQPTRVVDRFLGLTSLLTLESIAPTVAKLSKIADQTESIPSPWNGYYGDISRFVDPTIRPQTIQRLYEIATVYLPMAPGLLSQWRNRFELLRFWFAGDMITPVWPTANIFSGFFGLDSVGTLPERIAARDALIDEWAAYGEFAVDMQGGGSITNSDVWRNTRVYTELVRVTDEGKRVLKVVLWVNYLHLDDIDSDVEMLDPSLSSVEFGDLVSPHGTVREPQSGFLRYADYVDETTHIYDSFPPVGVATGDNFSLVAKYIYNGSVQEIAMRLEYEIELSPWNGPPPTLTVDQTHLTRAVYANSGNAAVDRTVDFDTAPPARTTFSSVTATVTGEVKFVREYREYTGTDDTFGETPEPSWDTVEVHRRFVNTGRFILDVTEVPISINDFAITLVPSTDGYPHPPANLVSLTDPEPPAP